ncbi:MAG TPA: hypothetical protein VM677_19690 [Actinokineospora sp.]|nr:hypothetical protein [Actinokineospora sp.]
MRRRLLPAIAAIALALTIPALVEPTATATTTTTTQSADPRSVSIPLGINAVTWAMHGDSDLPISLTTMQLQRIYRCLTTVIAGVPVYPLLPTGPSSLRTYWLEKMGITETDLAYGDYPCVREFAMAPNDTRMMWSLQPNYIIPFSTVAYVMQTNSAAIYQQIGYSLPDLRGPAVLGGIDGRMPLADGVVDVGFPFTVRACRNAPSSGINALTIGDMLAQESWAACDSTMDLGGIPSNIAHLVGYGGGTGTTVTRSAAPAGFTPLGEEPQALPQTDNDLDIRLNPGSDSLFNSNNGVLFGRNSLGCQYAMKFTIASTGVRQPLLTVLGQQLGSPPTYNGLPYCHVARSVQLYNWDTNEFASVSEVYSYWAHLWGSGEHRASMDFFFSTKLGDPVNFKGWTLLSVGFAVRSQVDNAPYWHKTIFYDTRMCSPARTSRWWCGGYIDDGQLP